MTPAQRAEILPLDAYEARRPELRQRALAARRLRTFHVGLYLTFQFENRETVRYQIQEMLRVERITREGEIQREIDTYNELLGASGELGCTLLIGIDDPGVRDALLPRWLDLPASLYVRLSDGAKVRASWDERQVGEGRLSSVQFLKFDVGGRLPVALGCDHPDPEAQGEALIEGNSALALAADLEDRELSGLDVPPPPRPAIGTQIGEIAPGFTLLDAERRPVSLSSYRGQRVVLAFFPGAFTGVCTREMCTLRDQLADLSALSASVIGVSVDSPFALAAFARQSGISFPLLSDYERRATGAYGLQLHHFAGMKGYTTTQRAVFLLDPEGRIFWRWVALEPGMEPDYAAVQAALRGAR